MKLIGVLVLKIKEILKLLLPIGFYALFQIIDWKLEGKLSELKPFSFLFKKFLHLNLLNIIIIVGIGWILLYLYNKFISPKRKLKAIIEKAEKFKSEYYEFIKFISDVYPRRQGLLERDKEQYLSYHNKLWELYLDISHPLLEYLIEINRGQTQRYCRMILDNIEKTFNSSNLEEHFRKNPLDLSTGYYVQTIGKFVAYLEIKV